jgi:hypothetical protein
MFITGFSASSVPVLLLPDTAKQQMMLMVF